jgi:hypothetical protein
MMIDKIGNFVRTSSGTLVDSTGAFYFNPGILPKTMTYNGPGGVLDTTTYGPDSNGNSFKQTNTFTGANITSVSAWVKV